MKTELLSSADAPRIRHIALNTWPRTFGNILSAEQISYMLEMMYSLEILRRQMSNGHSFYMLSDAERDFGFIGLQPHYPAADKCKIHKLYVLPSAQGTGAGKRLLEKAREFASGNGIRTLNLNVNRFNAQAISFYERQGFEIIKTEDIDIGKGFLMEDYQLELTW